MDTYPPDALVHSKVYAVYLCGPSPEGKFYVGQTSDWPRRSQTHALAAGDCPNFHHAIRRYGWAAFPVRFLAESDSVHDADQFERRYITEYNALYPHGYNMTTGGRGVLFDSSAKPDPNFVESPVTESEIENEGRWRLAHPVTQDRYEVVTDQPEVCPCCGQESACGADKTTGPVGCGISDLFGASILSHILAGRTPAEYELGEDKALRDSLRSSLDADWLIDVAKATMDVKEAGETLPVVAVQFAESLTPWIRRSLRRSVLAKKGLPSGSQGRLRIVPGSKDDAGTFLSVAKAFRRAKRDLGSSLISRVNVFQQLFVTYGTTPDRTRVTLQLLSVRGASSQELEEAQADAVVLRHLSTLEVSEFETLKTAYPVQADMDREYGLRLLARGLGNWAESDGLPAINTLVSDRLRVIAFPSLAARRDYVCSLAAMDPKNRLTAVHRAVSDPALVVRDVPARQ